MQSCELVASITAIACAISKTTTKEEIAVLVSAFNQLSNTLATILLQEEFLSKSNDLNFDNKSCKENASNTNSKNDNSNNDTFIAL